MLREFVASTILASLVRAAGLRDDAEGRYRAALVASQVVGLGLARQVLGLEPLAGAGRAELAAAIGPTLDRYLGGDLGPSASGAEPGSPAGAGLRPTTAVAVERRPAPVPPAPDATGPAARVRARPG